MPVAFAAVSPPLVLTFVTSADSVDRLPETSGEVALIGRSNVGKSSLLNALANRKQLARVSKSPGRTQLLNCFTADDGSTVVDCPGYGFANVPAAVRRKWQPMIEGYLLGRGGLRMILALVDGEIGPTDLDLQLLDWLRHESLPFTVVATKHDKVKAARRDKRRREVAEQCGVPPGDVVWVSAAKNVNIDRLRDLIRAWWAERDPT